MNSKSVKEGGKHNMYSKSKRFIASFLAVLMAVCMLPMDMFGAVGVVNAADNVAVTISGKEKLAAGSTIKLHSDAGDEDITSVSSVNLTDGTNYTVICDDNSVNVSATVTDTDVDGGEPKTIEAEGFTATATTTAIAVTVTKEITTQQVAVTITGGEKLASGKKIQLQPTTGDLIDLANGSNATLTVGTKYTVVCDDNSVNVSATVTDTDVDGGEPKTIEAEGFTATATTTAIAVTVTKEITTQQVAVTITGGEKLASGKKIQLQPTTGDPIDLANGSNATLTVGTKYTVECDDTNVNIAAVVVENSEDVEVTDGFTVSDKTTEIKITVTNANPNPSGEQDCVYTLDADAVAAEIEGFDDTAEAPGNENAFNLVLGDKAYFTTASNAKYGRVPEGYSGAASKNAFLITSGAMSTGQNYIKLTTKSDNASIEVYAAPKPGASAKLRIATSEDGKTGDILSQSANMTAGSVVKVSGTIASKGTYYVGFSSGGGIITKIVVTEKKTFNADTPDTPWAFPASGTSLKENAQVKIYWDDTATKVYYATGATESDTDDPKIATNPAEYTQGSPITITGNSKVIKLCAEKGGNKGNTIVLTYNILCEAPEAINKDLVVTSGTKIELTSDTNGADIYYTIDNTEPTETSSHYDAQEKIEITETTVIKAFATKAGMTRSETKTFVYIVSKADVKSEHKADGTSGDVTDKYFSLYGKTGESKDIQKADNKVWADTLLNGTDFWAEYDLEGTKSKDTTFIRLTGGSMSNKNAAVANAITFATSAPETEVVIYHSAKGDVKNDAAPTINIAKLGADGIVGDDASITNASIDSSKSKITKSVWNLEEPGIYCVGFRGGSAGGGIIAYMSVTENPNAIPAGEKVTLTFTNGDSTTTKQVNKGEEYTFTDDDKLDDTDDKVFLGWATADAPTVAVSSVTPNANTTLYAVWADKYVVTLEPGDATGTFTDFPAKVAPGAKVTLPQATSTDATKVFLGWKDKDVADATTIPAGEYEPTKSITLVPVFADAGSILTVTRDYGYPETGSETNKTDSFSVTKGSDGKAAVTLTALGTPTRDGWHFDGWVMVTGGVEGSILTDTVNIEANTTFLAKWTKNPEMYTVTFKDAEGNTVTTNPVIDAQVAENTNITLPATTNTKTDYDFEGWKVNGAGSVLSVGATYKVEGNVTFVESWKAKEGPETPSDIPKDKALYVRFVDADGDEVDPDAEYSYTGAKVEPKIEVYNYGRLLTLGTDYTVKYKNNINAGTNASLTVSGKGNLSGAANVITFTIKPADIKEDTSYPEKMTVAVNAKVAPVIMHGTKKLGNKDFTVEGEGLDTKGKYATAGDYTLTVKGKGNYDESSSFTIDVKVVEKKELKALKVAVDTKTAKTFKYGEFSVESISDLVVKPAADNGGDEPVQQADESGVTPIITVTNKDKKVLKEGEDFVIYTASSLNNAGSVKFTVVGMGEYGGTVNKSFNIQPAKITDDSKFKVSFKEMDYEYKASGVTVEDLEVRYLGEAATQAEGDDGILLTEGVDYKVAYSNNKKVSVGTKQAQIKITFLGNYKGSKAKTVPFTIVTAKMNAGEDGNTVVVVPEKVYSKGGKAYKSTPIVMVDGVAIKASNYTVHYSWKAESAETYTDDDKVKITLGEEDTCAHVKVTIEPKANASYAAATDTNDTPVAIEGEYYVVKKNDKTVDLSTAKVVFTDKDGNVKKSLDYNGKPFYTPSTDTQDDEEDPNAVYVKVTVKGMSDPVSPELYEVKWTNATEKGKATVVVTGTWEKDDAGNYAIGSKNASISIKPMKIAKTALPSNKKPVVAEAFKGALDKLF